MGAAVRMVRRRSGLLAVIPLVGAVLCGCSWTDRRGPHHLVLGFGIVTSTNEVGVEVPDTRVMGERGWTGRVRCGIRAAPPRGDHPAMSFNVILTVCSTSSSLMVSNLSITGSQPKDIEPSNPRT